MISTSGNKYGGINNPEGYKVNNEEEIDWVLSSGEDEYIPDLLDQDNNSESEDQYEDEGSVDGIWTKTTIT